MLRSNLIINRMDTMYVLRCMLYSNIYCDHDHRQRIPKAITHVIVIISSSPRFDTTKPRENVNTQHYKLYQFPIHMLSRAFVANWRVPRQTMRFAPKPYHREIVIGQLRNASGALILLESL